MSDREHRGIAVMRGVAANDNSGSGTGAGGGAEAQIASAVARLAWLIGRRIACEGWKIAGAYKDSAISGDSMILRPGIQALLEDARRGLFEILVAEALDRVSRDQADGVQFSYDERPFQDRILSRPPRHRQGDPGAAPPSRRQRADIDRELSFFRKHRHRMRYHALKQQGICSGIVEAANKILVTQRMKRSGMRWRIVGGQSPSAPCSKPAASRARGRP